MIYYLLGSVDVWEDVMTKRTDMIWKKHLQEESPLHPAVQK